MSGTKEASSGTALPFAYAAGRQRSAMNPKITSMTIQSRAERHPCLAPFWGARGAGWGDLSFWGAHALESGAQESGRSHSWGIASTASSSHEEGIGCWATVASTVGVSCAKSSAVLGAAATPGDSHPFRGSMSSSSSACVGSAVGSEAQCAPGRLALLPSMRRVFSLSLRS